MITKPQVLPMLLHVCPSFRPISEDHTRNYGGDVLYVILNEFARHLLDLFQARDPAVFPGVGRLIERLLIEGEPYVQSAVAFDLLEKIQIIWGDSRIDPEHFFTFFLPESARWWKVFNASYGGVGGIVATRS